MKWVALALVLLATVPGIAGAAVTAPAATISVQMTRDAYAVTGLVDGDVPVAQIAVTNETGAPIEGVALRVAFIRQTPAGYLGNETLYATTNADGVAVVTAGAASSLPGNYLVVAFALGTSGNDRYAVGVQ